MFKLVKLFQH